MVGHDHSRSALARCIASPVPAVALFLSKGQQASEHLPSQPRCISSASLSIWRLDQRPAGKRCGVLAVPENINHTHPVSHSEL